MPTLEKDFSRKQLWPRGPNFGAYKFANGYTLQKAMERWGPDPEDPSLPLDSGALRVRNGKWEVFIGSGEKGQWDDFNPLLHLSMAHLRNRFGLGGEAGGAFTGHGPTNVPQAFFNKFGRLPDPMEIEDYSHDPRLAATIFSGSSTDQPTQPTVNPKPVDPVKPPEIKPPIVIPPPAVDEDALQTRQTQRLMNLARPLFTELVRLLHQKG